MHPDIYTLGDGKCSKERVLHWKKIDGIIDNLYIRNFP